MVSVDYTIDEFTKDILKHKPNKQTQSHNLSNTQANNQTTNQSYKQTHTNKQTHTMGGLQKWLEYYLIMCYIMFLLYYIILPSSLLSVNMGSMLEAQNCGDSWDGWWW